MAAVLAAVGMGMAVGSANNVLFAAATNAKLETMRGDVKNYAGKNIALAMKISGGSLDDAVKNILIEVDNGFQDILGLTEDGQWAGVGGMFASLRDTWRGTELLIKAHNATIVQHGIIPFVERYVKRSTTPNIFDANQAFYLMHIGMMSRKDYNTYLEENGWDARFGEAIENLNFGTLPLEILLALRRRDWIDKEGFNYYLKRMRFDDRQAWMAEQILYQIPEPYRIADMAAKRLIAKNHYVEGFQWNGINEWWADRYVEANYQSVGLGTLMQLLWRNKIDQTTFNLMLERQAVHPMVKDSLLALAEMIPPASDIITMVVREAFEPSNIISAPKEFADWIAKQGYSQFWADKYWTAHFMPMSINQAYDNLRRGYWDEKQFKELLRIADVHPRWHDDILHVAFEPPAIRELGYGFDVGVYSREDIVKYRRWGGLSPEDAEKAADALIDYRLEAERNYIRAGYMNLFINNAKTEQEFRAKLKELRTNDSAIELWVERAKILIELKKTDTASLEPKTVTRTTIQWLFENGVHDEIWFRNQLKIIGYTDDAINFYLEQSKKQLEIEKEKEEKTEPKQLTISQLTDAYNAKLIDSSKLTSGILSLGYTLTDAQMITQLIIMKNVSPNAKLSIEQLTTAYYQGIIGQEKLIEHLKERNYNDDDIQTIIKLIDINRPLDVKPAKLTLAEIEDLYQFGYYDERQLIEVYKERGFSIEEAHLKTWLTILRTKIPMITGWYRNGWINTEELHAGLMELTVPLTTLGIPKERIDEMMMIIVKNNRAERTYTEKDLSKAEILKGAKNNVFTPAEATELLMDIGYDEAEAQYLLAINKIVAINDPRNYYHMKQATQEYRKSQGLKYVQIPNDLIDAQDAFRSANKRLKEARDNNASAEEIGKLLVETANAEARMNTIKSKLNLKLK